jgi:UDP-N-acetylglucosamine--N-acetylmuramyl-(pentapeptide) pyrophosphoryl-undecaprenol N-acetylglucosamine transferase
MANLGHYKVLFAGGGTAGHLMPAINIALELKRLDNRLRALFVGRVNGMESAIVKKFGFEIREIEVTGFKRNPLGLLRFILKWRKGLRQAKEILKDFDPAVVIGTGGYVSAPVVRAAYRAGKPVFLQEQNSLPGLATRTLSQMAERIFISYESAAKYIDKGRCILAGNPLRPDLLEAERESSYKEFGLDPEKKTLLVIGGSSGARNINFSILDIIRLEKMPSDWQLLWQTGQKDFVEISQGVTPDNIRGKIMPFIFSMPEAYAVADLIICRAGAMTLSEIAAWGLPSILIPYPYATGDHQTTNALQFKRAGAAELIPESEIGVRLESSMLDLMAKAEKRQAMATAARKLARLDAASIIANSVLEKVNAL